MYADRNHLPFRDKIVNELKQKNIFNRYILKTRSDLTNTNFYVENKQILDCSRGSGYCAWKPYFILEALNMLPENEILFYMDSMDYIINPYYLKKLCDKKFETYDYLFFTGNNPQKEYTRYDCFYLMNCLEEKYFNQLQIEAGLILIKNTPFIKQFIEEWLYYCTNYQIISFHAENLHGENDPIFKEHRDDQSILTNLVYKYNIPTIPITDQIRSMEIHCNYYKAE
jgi:hypothetical protein